MMRCFSVVQLIAVLLQIRQCTGVSDLSAAYSFSATLSEGYELYWNYNLTARTISFAVRVNTTGWVGFGFSPNGQMPGSDVVIGWVDESKVFFHVSQSIYNIIKFLLLYILYSF